MFQVPGRREPITRFSATNRLTLTNRSIEVVMSELVVQRKEEHSVEKDLAHQRKGEASLKLTYFVNY